MAVNLSPVGGVAAQFFNNDGTVLSGGKLNTYTAGTTTPATTYTNSGGTIAHSNPIIFNSAGRVPASGEIWLTDGITYKFVLTDANNVLIATYDNISGINSNFVAFTNEQEIQTATAGQTVFNLTTVTYQPATNSLSVFVDGVNQYGPGAQYAYVETDQDTVTFVSGLHVGASVKFTTSQLNSSGGPDASQVSYDPPFVGSVVTNVEIKLSEIISVHDFGAVGDGITDDAAAIQAAATAAAGRPIKFLPGKTYLTTATTTAADIWAIAYDATFRHSDAVGNHNLFTTSNSLRIEGGTYGEVGYEYNSTFFELAAAGAMDLLDIRDATFFGNDIQNRCFFAASTSTIERVYFARNKFRNIRRGGIELRIASPATDSDIIIENNLFEDINNALGLPVACIQLGSAVDISNSSHINNNTFRNVRSQNTTAETEVHAIIVYGRASYISGNFVDGVRNDWTAGSKDAEAIYVSAAYSRIVGNFVRNGANSNDGAITLKGSQTSTDPRYSDNCVIANNVVEFTDADYDGKGIVVVQNFVNVSNNVLRDLRATRSALADSIAIECYGGTSVSINDNVIIGFAQGIICDQMTDDCQVIDNLVKRVTTEGIYFRGANNTVIRGTNVSGNTVDGQDQTPNFAFALLGDGTGALDILRFINNSAKSATLGYDFQNGLINTLIYDNNVVDASLTTALNIDSTIFVRTQGNTFPAFMGELDADELNVTGDNTVYQLANMTEVFDYGTNFNPTTGVFTAPMSGLYRLDVQVFFSQLSASYTEGYVKIVTSTKEYFAFSGNLAAIRDANNQAIISGSFFARMNETQTAYVAIKATGGTKTVDVTQTFTRFSGNLAA